MSNSNMNFTAHGSITLTEKPSSSEGGSSIIKDVGKKIRDDFIALLRLFIYAILVVAICYFANLMGVKAQTLEKLKKGVERIAPGVSEITELVETSIALQIPYYTVLVATAPTEIQAHALATPLRTARINYHTIPYEGMWYVCVGQYYSFEQADRMKQQLRGRGFKTAAVVSPKR